jgi:hypothetical protein
VAEAGCSIVFAAAGAKTLTATYEGDADFASSKSPKVPHTVLRAASVTALSSSANPAVEDRTITFTASVTGSGSTPTGRVRFFVNGSRLGDSRGERLENGVAEVSTRLSAGTYVVTASYLGDSNYEGSTDTLTPNQVVTPDDDDGEEDDGAGAPVAMMRIDVVPLRLRPVYISALKDITLSR